jgi:cytoskeletal protein CcmA (bactofilin family)
MKDKDKPREVDVNKLAGLIDMDSEFTGDLTFKGSFRIEGTFHGTIKSDSLLVIGENGKVDAEIDVGHLVVNGEVKGVLQAREKVEIHGKGRVFGKIISPRVIIEDGAFLEANCQTQVTTEPFKPETAAKTQS